MELRAYGETYKVKPQLNNYVENDNTAVSLIYWDEEFHTYMPFCHLSTNIVPLEPGYCAIDTNNCEFAPDFIKENDLGEPTGQVLRSGFCTYPVYKMNMEKLEALSKEY